jgi:diguanylate cyclase (GGDEF)-like protein
MEYKQERFDLNKICQFHSREAESDFMEYERIASLNTVRILMLLMGIVFALFIFSDYYFYGDKGIFPAALGFRGIALFITLGTFFFIGKFKRYNLALVMVTLTQLAVFAIYLLNLYILHGNQTDLQYMSVMLFIMAVFLIPNVWKNCLIAGCVILVSYITFCLKHINPGELTALLQRGVYLCICFACCAVLIFGREKSRRRQFAAEKLMEFMSITDRLTGAYNRGRFEHVLGTWIKNMRHNPFSLLLFDIDDFKKVNDCFGHTVGDQVLVGISKIISSHIRDEDIFARWGGEEFVVLFGSTDITQAAELAERLRMAVEVNPYAEVGKVTISIGIAEYRKGETITDFVNRADEKMYEAKRAGKNRICVDNRQWKDF